MRVVTYRDIGFVQLRLIESVDNFLQGLQRCRVDAASFLDIADGADRDALREYLAGM